MLSDGPTAAANSSNSDWRLLNRLAARAEVCLCLPGTDHHANPRAVRRAMS